MQNHLPMISTMPDQRRNLASIRMIMLYQLQTTATVTTIVYLLAVTWMLKGWKARVHLLVVRSGVQEAWDLRLVSVPSCEDAVDDEQMCNGQSLGPRFHKSETGSSRHCVVVSLAVTFFIQLSILPDNTRKYACRRCQSSARRNSP